MVKIVKNPGNGRLNNLNDSVRNVLKKEYVRVSNGWVRVSLWTGLPAVVYTVLSFRGS